MQCMLATATWSPLQPYLVSLQCANVGKCQIEYTAGCCSVGGMRDSLVLCMPSDKDMHHARISYDIVMMGLAAFYQQFASANMVHVTCGASFSG